MSDFWFKGPIAEAVNDSDHSKQLEATLNDENLATVIKQKAIALKMSKDSEHATMFSQLYPISQVPVVYFICTTKDKLQELNKKRLEEEKAKAQENEIKRREQGKLAQETQQNLQEKQNKLHVEKMKREKKADEEYKKRVKEQIATDRANQIATRKAQKQTLEQNKTTIEEPSSSSTSSSFYDRSNLNIKQLDGSSLRHSFSSSDTLAIVSQWIDTSRTDGDMPFKLFAQFPNRNFDIGDEQRTLLELKLCPSGTLIMKPIKNATSAYAATSSSGGGGWLNYLYSAGDAVYNSVSSAGTTVSSYLITPTSAPEPGQRLGGPNLPPSSSSSATASNINTLDSARNKKDDDRQTYNGNSVNQE
ncbi:hypothetical protein HPULCUR_000513 [Helicostylum pulchrum]|uniref:UBX domain-containing protein n=1 Tax=Helicostylum pulchrum TaxID=562976 RepID=A0ABP9XK31_9FUNG